MRKSPDAFGAAGLGPPAWDDVRYFLAVAREGSLSAAARRLGVEHATVARRVAALEARIGVRLFDRLARSWALTGEGQALLLPAQRLEGEALAFGLAARAATLVQGSVRLSVPPVLGSHFLMPQLAARAAQWQGTVLELVGEVRTANLQRREADIALRLMRPTEPGLAARKLGEVGFRLYAAPDWLDRPAAEWRFLGYTEPLLNVPQQRLLATIAGDRAFALRSNDLATLHHACRAGLGLAMLPAFLARGDAALVELPHAELPAHREIWSVVHPDVRRSPRVRRMAELIAEVVRAGSDVLI